MEKRIKRVDKIANPPKKNQGKEKLNNISDKAVIENITDESEKIRNVIKDGLISNTHQNKLDTLRHIRKKLVDNINNLLNSPNNQEYILTPEEKKQFEDVIEKIKDQLDEGEKRISYLKENSCLKGFSPIISHIRLQGYKSYVDNLVKLNKLYKFIPYIIQKIEAEKREEINKEKNIFRNIKRYRDVSMTDPSISIKFSQKNDKEGISYLDF